MIRIACRVLTATLVATALCLLVLPPDIARALDAPRLGPVDGPVSAPAPPNGDVGFLPSQVDFVFSLPELGVELEVQRLEDGYLFWPTDKPGQWGFVSEEELGRVRFESSETGAGGISGRLTLEDGLGTPVDYRIDGTFGSDRSFFGTLSAPASGISHTVELSWPEGATADAQFFEGDGTLRNQSGEVVIIIVLSAAAVGAIACAFMSWWEECGPECSSACGDAGVDSFEEGACGTCRCDCNAPLAL